MRAVTPIAWILSRCVVAMAMCSGLAPAALAANDEPPPAKRPTVEQVVSRVQALYRTTRDLKGKFKQVYRDTLYDRARTSHGYLYVKKPGMMRWNYVSPEHKAFISDGKVLWIWEPEDKQAFRNPLDVQTLSTGLTFLLGAGDLAREFKITFATEPQEMLDRFDGLVLKLVPNQPTAQYSHLVMAVRSTDFAVIESMVVGTSSANHFIFSELVFNSRLGTQRFRFEPPSGTRVIDGTSAQR